MNKNVPAVNFTDFCKTATPEQIFKALNFYLKPFDINLVSAYFKGWGFKKLQKNAYRIAPSVNYNVGKFILIDFRCSEEYQFSIFNEEDERIHLGNYPNSFSDFISVVLNVKNIFDDFCFTDKAYDEIYGPVQQTLSIVEVSPRHNGGHVEIVLPNAEHLRFRITYFDKNDYIELNCPDGRIMVNPQATNLVKVFCDKS